jgi:hypothetical protein
MPLHRDEEATIRAFMSLPKRDRFLQLLANPKRRRRAVGELNHFAGWDPRFTQPLKSSADIVAELRAVGAPASCHVISDSKELDGQELRLEDAVERAEVFDFASVLCCDPGRIAFFFDEASVDRRRWLLRR